MKKVRLIYIFPLLLGTLSSCSDVWDEKTNNEWESKYIWTVSEVAVGRAALVLLALTLTVAG